MNMLLTLLLNSSIINLDIIDMADLLELMARFAMNLVFLIVIVRFVYYPVAKRKDFLFTYILISISIFLLCFLLSNVKLDLAFALGLFAIFGIIRYRTDAIPIKEMTYLFIVIGLSVMNALVNKKVSLAEMIFANAAITLAAYGLEKIWLLRHESRKTIIYEKIDLIVPEKRAELIADLQARTGINIHRIEIGQIDFLKDTTQILVFFYEDEQSDQMDETTGSNNYN
jgi:hypothetical protein